jgi:hypothetical protein
MHKVLKLYVGSPMHVFCVFLSVVAFDNICHAIGSWLLETMYKELGLGFSQ